jgi:hypothetical protein
MQETKQPRITGAVHAATTTGKHREAVHDASTYNSIGKEVIRLVGSRRYLLDEALYTSDGHRMDTAVNGV